MLTEQVNGGESDIVGTEQLAEGPLRRAGDIHKKLS